MTCTKGLRWSSSTETISCSPSTHIHTQHVEHIDPNSHIYRGGPFNSGFGRRSSVWLFIFSTTYISTLTLFKPFPQVMSVSQNYKKNLDVLKKDRQTEIYIYIYEEVIYVSLSDHNSRTFRPIGLKFWLRNSGEPRECS